MSGGVAPPSDSLAGAVRRGIDRLKAAQLPSGEFTSFATPLGVEHDWNPDSSVFVTSLCVLALQRIDSPLTEPLIDRAKKFLRSEASHGPLWRFWTHDNDRHLEIPCDADDSACATMALDPRSKEADRTRKLLLANRDRRGRFHTWFIPRGISALRPRMLRNSLGEWGAGKRRDLFWEMTEATPDDVDAVVNANVLRCFGSTAPAEAVAFVASVVHDGTERTSDSWHRNEFSCWYSVADGIRRGVPYDDEVGVLVRGRICERIRTGIGDLSALDSAHALGSLCALGDPGQDGEALATHLIRSQLEDGAWPRSIFFYGGPREVFAWGSEDLATAMSVATLTDYADAVHSDE